MTGRLGRLKDDLISSGVVIGGKSLIYRYTPEAGSGRRARHMSVEAPPSTDNLRLRVA
jgi:hypothetical protein